MKIKLLKDIPGYKAGEILEKGQHALSMNVYGKDGINCLYSYEILEKDGWAQEVEDEIDIGEIRREKNLKRSCALFEHLNSNHVEISDSDLEFFEAYRIVKAVIEKLDQGGNYEIGLIRESKNGKFSPRNAGGKSLYVSFLPRTNLETVLKVIELCGPELKVLFNVKE